MIARFGNGGEVDLSQDKLVIGEKGVTIINNFYQEYIPWGRVGSVEINYRGGRDAEKDNFMNWLRRMSDRHWKYARENKVTAARAYHRGKAQAYDIVLSGLQDRSLTSEYEQASAEHEGTEK